MNSIRILFMVSLVGLVAACGSDKGEGAAQPGSSITMSPASTSANIAVTIPAGVIQQPFTITVRNDAGNPLRGVRVDIFQDVASLLDSNLVLQTAVPYQAQTDDFGNIRV